MILPWTSDTYLDIHSIQIADTFITKNKTYLKKFKKKNLNSHCFNGAQKYRNFFQQIFFLVCATQPTHYSNEIIQTYKLAQNY